MEAQNRQKTSALRYHFLQWVRLCDEQDDLSCHTVFTPTASLLFPVSDFTLHDNVIEVNFLSLLGSMSPLPHHFNMPMLSPSRESESFYAFLSMLNAIFYRAFYAAWKANHLHLFKKSRAMYHDMFSPYAPMPWLVRPYLQVTPTLMGLRALLYRLCDGVEVNVIHENGFQRVTTGLSRLGGAFKIRLSDNVILGDRVLSHEGKILVTIGPLPCANARAWLPTEPLGKRAFTQASHYVGVGVTLSWRVRVSSQEAIACLGREDALSRYAFLGKSQRELMIRNDSPS